MFFNGIQEIQVEIIKYPVGKFENMTHSCRNHFRALGTLSFWKTCKLVQVLGVKLDVTYQVS